MFTECPECRRTQENLDSVYCMDSTYRYTCCGKEFHRSLLKTTGIDTVDTI